ncbi:MAG: pilus assembly PilX N-terminal domain-containing protein [Candidatus Omnitrophota bacterium]
MNNKGVVLVVTMTFLSLLLIGGSSYLYMVTNEARQTERQVDAQKAFFLANAGIQRGIWKIKNDNPNSETFKLKGGGSAVNYLEDKDIAMTITPLPGNVYEIKSTSTVGNSTKTLSALIGKNQQARVFDYGYFINNWGWFYGSGITSNGDVRSNGRFDFRSNPTVEGEIYARFEIDDGGQGISGSGGEVDENGDYPNQHPYSDKLDMPNLSNLSYYEDSAKTNNGTIKKGGITLINNVFGDDAGESNGNIILIGTSTNPIEISGTVVARGDVIIKGYVKGHGAIYAGRNIYIADDIVYKNSPSTPRPSSDDPAVVDAWVDANKDKDLVGFAARESVILGDYTGKTGGSWTASSYLYSMGDEDVGQDGIPDTNDTWEDNGVFESQYEDLDGDGVKDGNYNVTRVQTQTGITNFANCPVSVNSFDDIATNYVNYMDGIFYTNHAFAGRVGYSASINGAIISKDEAILYRDTLTMNYDERIHSRYSTGEDVIIDVPELPVDKGVTLIKWWED